jgi:hypothetical protein
MPNITADSVEEIWLDGVEIPLLKIKNLRVVFVSGSREKRLVGKTFPFILNRYFYHQVLEGNAQYELIKTLEMNIDPVFITDGGLIHSESDETHTALFLESLKKLGSFVFLKGIYDEYKEDSEHKEIYGLRSHSLLFDEVYMFNDFSHFLSGCDWPNEYIPFWDRPGFTNGLLVPFVTKCTQHMRESFLKKMYVDDSSPKLLYISRKDANVRHKKDWDSLSDTERSSPTHGNSFFYLKRSFNKDSIVEKYYTDNGFTSVCFEGMSYMEQLHLVFNAKTIATSSGSGCVNLFIAQSGSQAIEIGAFPEYGLTYGWLCDLAGLKWDYVSISDELKDDLAILDKLRSVGVQWHERSV